MNYWTTRDGTKIQVKNMELSHVENTLRMLINKYTLFCIQHGAIYASSINLDKMTEKEKKNMLDKTCADRNYLKRMVSTDCFREDIYKKLFPE